MLALMAKNWWIIAIRGVAAIIFGIVAIVSPGIALSVLIAVFGAYALVDGGASIIAAVRGDPETRGHGWSVVIMGAISVIAGLGAFLLPGATALAILYVIAAWGVILGVAQIAAAIRLRREIEGEWLMVLGGVASIAFGALLVVFPGAGILSVLLLVGGFAIVFGLSLLGLAWRLRGLQGSISTTGRAATA